MTNLEQIKILAIQIESDTNELLEDEKLGIFNNSEGTKDFSDRIKRISDKIKQWSKLVAEELNEIENKSRAEEIMESNDSLEEKAEQLENL